jgi:hypothetical protein
VILTAAPNKPEQLVSNLTHYSPADPEVRITFKTGKPRQLAYTASVSVDASHHVITHIQADLADWRDSRYLLVIVDMTQQWLQTFGVAMTTVVANASYCSGENYEQLEVRGLTGYIPAHGGYKGQYDRMLQRLATRVGKGMRRLRSATVERVLGSLINYFGLRQLSKKDQAGTVKVLYAAAMTYNLKKYWRFCPLQQGGQLVALPAPDQFSWLLLYFCNSY